MLFPGVTKAFQDQKSAENYLNTKLQSDAKKLFKVIFKVKVGGEQLPMDAKKFIGEDEEMKGVELPDALFYRLTAQVRKYSVDENGKIYSSKDVKKSIQQKDGDPTRVKNTFKVLHIFDLQ